MYHVSTISFFFFFNDTATTEIYTLSLHDALPIYFSPAGASPASHGYLRVASRVALVRFRPVPGTLASSLVSKRRLCAFPSNPPQPAATWASADSPLCPNGGCPRSWARQAASTRSGSQPSAAPTSLPICAHSSEAAGLV